MADRASRKARQRQKREKKRQALRRAASVSPYKRAAAGALVACHVNADWRERGQATVYVLRRSPGPTAGLAMATFFVDLWCAGLKTVWGRFDILREEYDDVVERMGDRMDASMPEVPLEQAAAIVAGGIRFAVQNGFRLPAHYQRWTAFLGGKLDWQHADISAFGVEGGRKLRWVAPMEDLRARLIGSTVEQFLARPDVEFIGDLGGLYVPADVDEEWDDEYEDDEDYGEDDDDDEGEGVAAGDFEFGPPRLEDAEVISATDRPVGNTSPPQAQGHTAGGPTAEPGAAVTPIREEAVQQFARLIHNLIAVVEAWCFNEGIVPSPQLEKAAAFTLASGAMTRESGGGEAEAETVVDRLMQTVPDQEVDDVEAGVKQTWECIRSFPSLAAFTAAMEAAGRRRDEEEKRRADAAPAQPESAERRSDALPEPRAANATDARRA